ncbi:hypothetical protein D3C72_1839670 [compost metagenome]
MQLVVADIDGIDAGGTALHQHLGEAAGGSAHIETGLARRVDAASVEPGHQLERGAGNVVGRRVAEGEFVRLADHLVRLAGRNAVDGDRAAQDGITRTGAAGQQAPLLKREIEADALAHPSTRRLTLAMAVSVASS